MKFAWPFYITGLLSQFQFSAFLCFREVGTSGSSHGFPSKCWPERFQLRSPISHLRSPKANSALPVGETSTGSNRADRAPQISNRKSEIKANELQFDQGAATRQLRVMSAQEIIAELPKLRPEELRLVQAEVEALAATLALPGNRDDSTKATGTPAPRQKPLSTFLLRVAGTAQGLPADLAENHDHYLYGVPKRG
jgi:hypothetical protein